MQDEFSKLFDGIEPELDYDTSTDLQESLRENLRSALEQAIEDISSIDDMWSTFRDHLTDALLERSMVQEPLQSARVHLLAHLWTTERSTLIERAAVHLAKSNSSAVVNAAANLILSQPETRAHAETLAIARLSEELRESVRATLIVDLGRDPTVIDEVKRELKRKLLDM